MTHNENKKVASEQKKSFKEKIARKLLVLNNVLFFWMFEASKRHYVEVIVYSYIC